jgi:hypothetical protein
MLLLMKAARRVLELRSGAGLRFLVLLWNDNAALDLATRDEKAFPSKPSNDNRKISP